MSDTTGAMEDVQLRLLRQRSPSERLTLALRLSGEMIDISKRAVARAHPGFTTRQLKRCFIALHYGETLADAADHDVERIAGRIAGQIVGQTDEAATMNVSSDLALALRPVLDQLTRLSVRHYVGGSVASSFHGAARSTLDVDVVAELDQGSATSLVESLRGQYYVSDSAVRDAIRLRSCFNLIHFATSFKIDIFVNKGRAFDVSALERAVVDRLVMDDSALARIATAEDVILAKLEWYRLGGEVSERQWRDVTLVAKLQGPRLDWDYLNRFAAELGVVDLLERLRAEALE